LNGCFVLVGKGWSN